MRWKNITAKYWEKCKAGKLKKYTCNIILDFRLRMILVPKKYILYKPPLLIAIFHWLIFGIGWVFSPIQPGHVTQCAAYKAVSCQGLEWPVLGTLDKCSPAAHSHSLPTYTAKCMLEQWRATQRPCCLLLPFFCCFVVVGAQSYIAHESNA